MFENNWKTENNYIYKYIFYTYMEQREDEGGRGVVSIYTYELHWFLSELMEIRIHFIGEDVGIRRLQELHIALHTSRRCVRLFQAVAHVLQARIEFSFSLYVKRTSKRVK